MPTSTKVRNVALDAFRILETHLNENLNPSLFSEPTQMCHELNMRPY